MAESPWIINTSTPNFEADVIERSKNVPVVVDFWAEWCNPCRQLTPILEKLAQDWDGKFELVKVNVEESPEIASLFGVQEIPRVVAFRDGQPVNQFLGVLPEDQLREWFASILPTPVQDLVAQGAAIEAEDPAAAEQAFRQALDLDATDASAKIHLARVLLAQGNTDECAQIIAELGTRGFLEPEAENIQAQLDVEAKAQEAGGVLAAKAAVAAEPDVPLLQLKLADALAAEREYQEAMDICLSLIQQDRAGIGVEAKATMVRILGLLGPESELAGSYRRKLATVLY